MNESIIKLLDKVEIPAMAEAEQNFVDKKIVDIEKELSEKAKVKMIDREIAPGMEIAVTAGSRGIANIGKITKWTIDYLKAQGANPFIVPAMGSHGSATAHGQVQVLEAYGITEEKMGAPIRSSMEVVKVGKLEDGLPVYLDKLAYNADGIVVINRIKPHTGFRNKYESGLMKMLSVGLGKQAGADAYHSNGLTRLGEYVIEAGEFLLKNVKVVMGIGIIENAYDETLKLDILKSDEFAREEESLLKEAFSSMPHIKFRDLDLLIIDKIGKNYSGAGLDPNITGKFINPDIKSDPVADKIAVLALSEETYGNGNGIGLADVTTERVVDQMDFSSVYMNGLTSGVSASSKIPMYYQSDMYAIKAAIKLTGKEDFNSLRIVRIPNTMELKNIMISSALLEEADNREDVTISSDLKPLAFDEKGNLF